MSDDVLIRVEGTSKRFCRTLKRSLWYGVQDIVGELLGRDSSSLSLRPAEFWAVNDVSFEVRRGECLGLIGPNGAGKSTLLKMLNGLIKPDRGRIEICGRVGALIELGAGFSPILTGRENIYVNAAVLGLSGKETDKKLNSIIDFAEIGEFIDAPVQTYSSGMKVRLGFAVAAHLEPDVLLIDEILAVGDMAFHIKCFNLMERALQDTTIVYVSHNLPQVARTCTHGLALNKGRIAFRGTPSEVIDSYLANMEIPDQATAGSGEAELLSVHFDGESADRPRESHFMISYLDDLSVRLRMRIAPEHASPVLYLAVYDRELKGVGEVLQKQADVLQNNGREIEVRVTFPRLNLSRGVYSLSVGVLNRHGGRVLGRFQAVRSFQVTGDHPGWMPVHFEARFEQIGIRGSKHD